ncbi:MAG TPA: 50S ribosomal protein L21 [Candidatus Woesebacteria bacterium]|nr:50S ribosomal protein L21 [Candidatus Woesebacteria bacterium]HPJ17061.1 50S ribosomal protein L21 [Candidatus Woesebacteria bacterium]
MKYAVISISGSQFLVSEGQTITIDKFTTSEKKGEIKEVLLTVNDDKVTVGTPIVDKATVEYEIVKDFKGEKIEVSTYRSKSRYRRHLGFRAQLTDLKITKLNF